MEFVRLENTDSCEFREAWKIYESSFPSDEKRTLDLQKGLIRNEKYNFFIALEDENLSGIITSWDFEGFSFIEHLAVRKDLREGGIGTLLLREYLSVNKQKVVLEVERPDTEIAARRIGFYERIGFKLNDFDYIQPSYGEGKNPVRMLLMSYLGKLNESEFSSIREIVHTTVYGLEEPLLDWP